MLGNILSPEIGGKNRNQTILFRIIVIQGILYGRPIKDEEVKRTGIPVTAHFIAVIIISIIRSRTDGLQYISFEILLPKHKLIF